MYGHGHSQLPSAASYACSSTTTAQCLLPPLLPPSGAFFIPSAAEGLLGSASSCSSGDGSPPSWMPRSMSSNSVQAHTLPLPAVRRAFSAGDLRPESPLAAGFVGLGAACRYNPEEKRERIERYRRKRNQRNFTKKIKYACRKTLADRRPRVRGRFARNEEEAEQRARRGQLPWAEEEEEEEGEEGEVKDNFWVRLLQSFPLSP